MGQVNIATVSMVILSLVATVFAAQRPGAPASIRAELRSYLTRQVGFSDGDWRDILAGEAVARQLDMPDAVDVSIYGAVRIDGRADALVSHIREIDTFERKLKIRQVGRFADPPALEDLADLRLTDQDLDDLRNCRPGDCELQLSADAMQQIQTRVDWDRDGARERAQQVFREIVFDTLRAYRIGGVAALGAYADRDPPTPIAEEVHGLAHPGDSPAPIGPLLRYLGAYPAPPPPGAESFFYWNHGEFSLKPTVRLNHVVIFPVRPGPASMTGARWVIATRQIYANHYFSATLELRTLVDDDEDGGFFLLYATRSRVTGLSGFFKAIIRAIVKRRARSGMERYLNNTKAVVEGRADAPTVTPSAGRR